MNFDQPLALSELSSFTLNEYACDLGPANSFTSSQLPNLRQLFLHSGPPDEHIGRFAPILSHLKDLKLDPLRSSDIPYLTRSQFSLQSLDIECSESATRDLIDWLATSHITKFYYHVSVADEEWDDFFRAVKRMMKVISQNPHLKLVRLNWHYGNQFAVNKDAWVRSFAEWKDLKNGLLATCRQRGIEVDVIDCQRSSSDSPWRWGDDIVSSIHAVVKSSVFVIDAGGFPLNFDLSRTFLTSFEHQNNGEV